MEQKWNIEHGTMKHGTKATTRGVLLFLRISQYSQENTCVESFFNKDSGLQAFLKRDSNTGALQQNF